MTVISAVLSRRGIAVATDSLLAVVDPKGENIHLEWEKSKIIPVPKLRGCISYWGFAGVLKKIPKRKESPDWSWNTYDWLKSQSENPKFSNIEDFSNYIRENLDNQLCKLNNIKAIHKGIGLHITGIEKIDGYAIPELFLVSNFLNPSYQQVGELRLSRNTFHTINKVPPSTDHNKKEFRFKVKDFLNQGMLISYNNGDPIMFNMVSSTISAGFQIAAQRNVLKKINSVKEIVPIAKRPIEIISLIQKDFYRLEHRSVGGKIHDLSIDNSGNFNSTSGDY